jgi:hypothetical protein
MALQVTLWGSFTSTVMLLNAVVLIDDMFCHCQMICLCGAPVDTSLQFRQIHIHEGYFRVWRFSYHDWPEHVIYLGQWNEHIWT